MDSNEAGAARIEHVAIKYQGGDVEAWKAAGVTVILDRAGDLELRRKCRRIGLQYFRIYNVFYPSGPDIEVDAPAMLSDRGTPARGLHASMCNPADASVRRAKLRAIEEDLARFEPDGVSLDFIRFHLEYENHRSPRWRLDWEEVPPDASAKRFIQFSFDRQSLLRFELNTGLALTASVDDARTAAREILIEHRVAWRDFKCQLVTSMVADIRRRAVRLFPETTVMIHLVPWRPDEFDRALGEVAGQDPVGLAEHVDVFAPMVYHPFLDRGAAWVGQYTRELLEATGKQVWPCIQAMPIDLQEHDDLPPYDLAEMKAAWESAQASGTDGITLYGPAADDRAAMQFIRGRTSSR